MLSFIIKAPGRYIAGCRSAENGGWGVSYAVSVSNCCCRLVTMLLCIEYFLGDGVNASAINQRRSMDISTSNKWWINNKGFCDPTYGTHTHTHILSLAHRIISGIVQRTKPQSISDRPANRFSGIIPKNGRTCGKAWLFVCLYLMFSWKPFSQLITLDAWRINDSHRKHNDVRACRVSKAMSVFAESQITSIIKLFA